MLVLDYFDRVLDIEKNMAFYASLCSERNYAHEVSLITW